MARQPGTARRVDATGQVHALLSKDHLGPDVLGALAALGDGVIPLLGTIATGERPADPYERENAIYALGMIGAEAAVAYLRRVLWTPDLSLQLLAARALGRIGSPAAVQELRRLYNGYRAPAPTPWKNGSVSATARPAPDRPRRGDPGPGATGPLPAALALELREILSRWDEASGPLH